jgi:hypothetical protein
VWSFKFLRISLFYCETITEISIFSINNISAAVQLSEIVRALSQEKLIFPAVESIAYKLTKEERNEIKRINNSLKSNYVLTYIFLIYKKRKAEYTNILRKLRNEIPLNFTQFIIFSEDESRPRKRQRIANNTNNSENKDFDDFNFVQNYIKFRFPHPPNFSGKDEKK